MIAPSVSNQLKELDEVVSGLESAVERNEELAELVDRLKKVTEALNEYFEHADGE